MANLFGGLASIEMFLDAFALNLAGAITGGGVDKAHDTRGFVRDCPARKMTPYVAHRNNRWSGSVIDGRTSRHILA